MLAGVQCQGFVRASASSRDDRLRPCLSDAEPGSDFCTYHAKVAAGLILDAAWKPKVHRNRPRAERSSDGWREFVASEW
jgi:hypothetical protein